MFHTAPGVIVLEQRPRWEAALKRNISDSGIRVRACRKSKEALNLLEQMDGSVLVIDLMTGSGEALRLTETISRRSLSAGIVIVGSATESELEWPFREFGAHAFFLDSLRGEMLADTCRRALARSFQ